MLAKSQGSLGLVAVAVAYVHPVGILGGKAA